MKTFWMAFGLVTVVTGCASEKVTVEVEPHVGSTSQGVDSACFDTDMAGAESWIDDNCSNGGTIGYSAGSPDGEHCMTCREQTLAPDPGGGGGGYFPGPIDPGAPTITPPSSGPGGGGGGGGSTTTPTTAPSPGVDTDKTKFLCTCCETSIEWIGQQNLTSSTDCGPSGLVACAPFGDHPRAIDNFATDESQLGKSGSFVQQSVAPTTTDWLGNDHTVTTYWSHMDDGDSVRFFSDLIDYKNDGLLGEIAGILPVAWEVTALVEATKVLSSISTRDLLAAYNAAGSKNGIYVKADEDWEEFNPGGDHYTPGKMNFTYSIYLRETGTLLGTVTGSDPANGPEGHVAEQDINGNLQMPAAQFQQDAYQATGQQCSDAINASQPPPTSCTGGNPSACQNVQNQE